MNKLLLIIALVLVFSSAKAHNPNTTSVVISPQKGIWTAHFVISQEGANYALARYHPDTDFSSLSMDDYKKYYIDYIKAHTKLSVDGNEIALGSGGIKLGNHQTDIQLLIPSFPKAFTSVDLNLSIFEENEQQHTVVRFKDGDKEFRKVLSKKNEFSLKFKHAEGAFEERINSDKDSGLFYLAGFVFVLMTGVLIGSKTYQAEKLSD